MSSRTTCSPVSLYRLEGDLDLADYLLSVPSKEIEDHDVVLDGIHCRLVMGQFRAEHPHWADHVMSLTERPVELPSYQPFSILLVPIPPWTYALCWGSGHLLINDELVEQSFGLIFGVRRLDATDLRTVARSSLDAIARITETSLPSGGELGSFGLEPFGESVNRISGSANLDDLTYGRETGRRHRIEASNSLKAPLPRDSRALISDLRVISRIADEPDADSPLRFIGQTRRLPKSHPKSAELDSRLARALGGNSGYGVLGYTWPPVAARAAQEAESFKVKSLCSTMPRVLDIGFELDELTNRLAQEPEETRLHRLGRAQLIPCADPDGREEISSPTSLRKWIVFETTIDHVRYCYQQGKWFRIGEGRAEQIRDQVATLLQRKCLDLMFPLWTPTGGPNDEHQYCLEVAKQPGYLCLDRSLARTPFHPKFELCDVVGPKNELIHIKWLGAATAASHLYTQASVSANSLRFEPEALDQLRTKIQGLDASRVDTTPSKVVLAIAGRRWDVDKLFTLSQLSLLKLDWTLRFIGARLEFANIPYTRKKSR